MLGVKQKLDLAFFSIASFSIVIMIIACTLMVNIDRSIESVSGHLVPKLSLSTKLQKTAEKTSLLIDKFMSTNDGDVNRSDDLNTLNKHWEELSDIVQQVQSQMNGLSDRIGFSEELAALNVIQGDHGIISEVVFDHGSAIIGSKRTHEKMLRLIRIFDETMLPKVSRSTRHRNSDLVNILYQGGNDLSNHLLSVNSENDSSEINRLKRKCLALYVSLTSQSNQADVDTKKFMGEWLGLVSPLIRGDGSVFVLRLDEIRIANVLRKQFSLNQRVVDSLENKAVTLVAEMQRAIRETAHDTHEEIERYVYILVLISFISVGVSLLLVWSLVHKNVITRLLATSEAIIKLSRGNIDIDIARPAEDELGKMQVALEKLREYVIRVQTASKTDSLTGLNNRGSFDSLLKMELGSLANTAREMSLLMLDIDYFKNYNDAYGHVKGDECIQAVSKVLQQHCRRDGDVVARYGGEEFVMILPATSNEHAINLAESIRIAIQDIQIPHSKSLAAKCVTVSVGVSTISFHEKTQPEDFIKLADIALYKAKNNGRNRVESLS